MLQRLVGCSWSTGAMPVGLGTQTHRGELPGDVLDERRHVLLDVAEVELHPDEVREWDPVDDDPRRARGAAVALMPLEPEEDVVATPRPVVAVVGEREPEAGRVLAADERRALDLGRRLVERSADLLHRRLGQDPGLPGGHHFLRAALAGATGHPDSSRVGSRVARLEPVGAAVTWDVSFG